MPYRLKIKMMNLRKLSVLAISALLVTGISGLSTVAGTPKTATTSASLTDLITSLINSVGDDTFSTIDLTTLVNSLTSAAPTPLHSSISAARTQPSSSSSGTSTQHYGPYASGSTDSGTCGNDWANDLFNRHFTVFSQNGAFSIVEQFKDGSFTTPASDSPTTNFSPGGCETSSTPQGTVNSGVTGSLHGYFVIPLPATETQTSFDPSCVAGSPSTPCTTSGFIDSHFTPCYFGGSGSCPVTTFFFHYAAGGQGLIINEWKNASTDRGGNSGDIRSTNI